MCKSSKMQWFVDLYKSNNLKYQLKNTHQLFGTIVMPTGYGKSSVVYEDIIHAIDNYKGGRKLIINISCPILKLTQQFVSDLFSILSETHSNRSDIAFYVNSSDNGNNYNDFLSDMGIDISHFSKFGRFIESEHFNIAIVASCHKSLYKFINMSSKIKNADIINYIDEAHLIDLHPNNTNKDVICVDIDKMCRFSSRTYAFTATPNADVTAALNKWNSFGPSATAKYILHVRPIEAIKENIIVAPLVKFIPVDDNVYINASALNYIMKNACAENPNINHKVLVTLNDSKHLVNLRKELENLNYKVFSTCSAYGFGTDEQTDDNTEITQFIDDVDNYNDNCFVLHIRQLTQGIDIKSLTDCVIYNASHGSQEHYRHTIQIIGRVLRPYTGERGLSKDKRLKKVGGVYFLTPSSAEEAKQNIEQFIVRYYGFNNVTFESYTHAAPGQSTDDIFDSLKNLKHFSIWDNPQIIELMCNIEKYIEKQFAPMIKFILKNGGKIDLKSEATKILAKYDTFNKDMNTSDLLDNKDLLDKVIEILNSYNVNTQLF